MKPHQKESEKNFRFTNYDFFDIFNAAVKIETTSFASLIKSDLG
jgi:hypothetical protein